MAALYWLVPTTPPAKAGATGTPTATLHNTEMPHSEVAPASFDSILTAARKALPAHAAGEVAGVEQAIASIRDSSQMAPSLTQLARIWQEHKQLPVAAYYFAQAAKLENSEKNLNFAGQFFLELLHQPANPGVQMWEAQQAIAVLQRSLDINPDNDTTKMALAAGYIEGTGETMAGVQILLGIVREKPDNVPANLMLGKLAIQSGQYDKAVERLEGIIAREPKNTEAMYFLAEAYKGKGDIPKAKQLLEQCKKLVNSPDFSRDIDEYLKTF